MYINIYDLLVSRIISSFNTFRQQYVHFYHFLPQMTVILELFHFQLMDLTIERWFPIKLGKLYTMKPMVMSV